MATTPTPNSATGGFMVPAAPDPKYDDALEDVLHDTIAGILGLDGKWVRPRVQPEPPNQPEAMQPWVAFGIMDTEKDWDPFMSHDSAAYAGDGATGSEQDEQFVVLLSFYGPTCNLMQSLFEDCIKFLQNRYLLEAEGIKFVSLAQAHAVPALLKDRWVKRKDQRMTLRRRVVRKFPVLNLVSADIDLDNEHYHTDIPVNPPTP